MYLAPKSTMIKNRTRERFNTDRRFAEIALKAALAVDRFQVLDIDMDGEIEINELISCFAKIHGVTF
jgi:hypothetical protein